MKIKFFLVIILITPLFLGCPREDIRSSDPEVESWTTGNLAVYCEDELKPVFDSAFSMYGRYYKEVTLDVEYSNSRNLMSNLLSGNARIIIVARDYLDDEDSLMKEYEVEPHERFEIAFDALAIVANKNFPLDTLNHEQLKAALTGKGNLKNEFPVLIEEPVFVFKNQNTSQFANILQLISDNGEIKTKFKMAEKTENIIESVIQNENTLGIEFLSKVFNREDVKLLRIGFTDSTGKYIKPATVHPGYVVQDKYPYKVPYYVYLLEKRRNLPYWFGKFLSTEKEAQQYFLKQNLVPAFARIKLTPED